MNFQSVTEFENKIAEFFGAPFAVATDSATHGIELCLRYDAVDHITVPKRTYLSVPFLAEKLGIDLYWKDEDWKDCYEVSECIYDAAVLWKPNSYIENSMMCISFQYQKHLSLGRGGMILCDNKFLADELKKMSYDGRLPGVPWRDQDIKSHGFHYYMQPEIADLGLQKIDEAIKTKPKEWVISDWPDLTTLSVFK